MKNHQETSFKRGKTCIMGGFILFAFTLLSFFLTVKFFIPQGVAPANSILFTFASFAILAMLLALSGVIILVRAIRK